MLEPDQKYRAFHPSAQSHRVVRSLCIPPINTGSHGGQIIIHSTHQHRPSWWSDHRAFHPSAQSLRVVRSLCIPPISTGPHGGQIILHPYPSTQSHRVVRSSCIPPVNGPIWQSDHRAFHPSTQAHRAVRSLCIPPDNTVPHGSQIDSLWGCGYWRLNI